MDDYLGKRMQNWATRVRPPGYCKADLLRNAAQAAYLRSHGPEKTIPKIHLPLWRLIKSRTNSKRYRDHSAKFFDWTIVYSFEMSLVNLKLMF